MAAQESFGPISPETVFAPGRDARGRAELAISPHPLHSEEGVLYSDYELPDYSEKSGEPTVTYGKGRSQGEYGTTYIDRWRMNDEPDTEYTVMRCETSNPREGVNDVWVVKDTAWSTQVTGLNTDVARELMDIGFNVLIKGPEINSSLPLSQSAFNTHKVLDGYEKRGDLEAGETAVEGYSRGAMLAFGYNAYAKRFGFNRNALYSNLTDPCVAIPIKLNPPDLETLKKAATLHWDIGMLAWAAARGVFNFENPARGLNLLKTVDVSKDGLVQFIRTGIPLMNGEAGMMAARTPLDMKATIAFFHDCRVNDKAVYKKILADRPGVEFKSPPGGHGAGIDGRIIGNIALRFGRLAEQLEEGRTSEEIDYTYIHHTKQAA